MRGPGQPVAARQSPADDVTDRSQGCPKAGPEQVEGAPVPLTSDQWSALSKLMFRELWLGSSWMDPLK